MRCSWLGSCGAWPARAVSAAVMVSLLFLALHVLKGPCSSAAKDQTAKMRKLLMIGARGGKSVERMGLESCSKDDVVVYQGAGAPMPNGIPTYTVQILNVCLSGCTVSDIHVACGWFSSARLINPRVFRRLDFNDCLANDGAPLGPGESLSFQYANSFRYPLDIAAASCY